MYTVARYKHIFILNNEWLQYKYMIQCIVIQKDPWLYNKEISITLFKKGQIVWTGLKSPDF